MPSLFLVGFLFSSAICFSLAGGDAALAIASARVLPVSLLLYSIVIVLSLDCDFNILTMAYYILNESSRAL